MHNTNTSFPSENPHSFERSVDVWMKSFKSKRIRSLTYEISKLICLTDAALKNCRSETAKEVACFNEIIDQRSYALEQLKRANLLHDEIYEWTEGIYEDVTVFIDDPAYHNRMSINMLIDEISNLLNSINRADLFLRKIRINYSMICSIEEKFWHPQH